MIRIFIWIFFQFLITVYYINVILFYRRFSIEINGQYYTRTCTENQSTQSHLRLYFKLISSVPRLYWFIWSFQVLKLTLNVLSLFRSGGICPYFPPLNGLQTSNIICNEVSRIFFLKVTSSYLRYLVKEWKLFQMPEFNWRKTYLTFNFIWLKYASCKFQGKPRSSFLKDEASKKFQRNLQRKKVSLNLPQSSAQFWDKFAGSS